jgi:hypothetical protein
MTVLAQSMPKAKGAFGMAPAGKAAAGGPIPRAAAIATWKKRIDEILRRGALPIIDVQATYVRGVTKVDWLIEQMRALDVAQIVFASAMAPDSSPVLELQQKHPEYFVPAYCFPDPLRDRGRAAAGARVNARAPSEGESDLVSPRHDPVSGPHEEIQSGLCDVADRALPESLL